MNGPPASVRRGMLGLAALGLLCLGLTPGDVGGCGQPIQQLDARRFFREKLRIDCERCRDCGLTTDNCERACDSVRSVRDDFPEDCVPLVHDGEVCLRRLLADSCEDYAAYVADVGTTVPTECDFCPARD